jgi:hypothetical protein
LPPLRQRCSASPAASQGVPKALEGYRGIQPRAFVVQAIGLLGSAMHWESPKMLPNPRRTGEGGCERGGSTGPGRDHMAKTCKQLGRCPRQGKHMAERRDSFAKGKTCENISSARQRHCLQRHGNTLHGHGDGTLKTWHPHCKVAPQTRQRHDITTATTRHRHRTFTSKTREQHCQQRRSTSQVQHAKHGKGQHVRGTATANTQQTLARTRYTRSTGTATTRQRTGPRR